MSVELDGVVIRVAHWPGSGPDLVLLHGAGSAGASWGPIAERLTDFSVWAPDLPGRAGSPGDPLSDTGQQADWVDRLMNALGLQAPVVVGHSLGGAVAQQLALRRAHGTLSGVVLISSGARLRVAPPLLAAAAAATDGSLMSMSFAFVPTPTSELSTAYEEAAALVPARSTLADWQACDTHDCVSLLDLIGVPVLVLHGDEDLLTPSLYQRYLEDHLPLATRVEVEGAGHMLPWDDPDAVVEAIEAWAQKIGLH